MLHKFLALSSTLFRPTRVISGIAVEFSKNIPFIVGAWGLITTLSGLIHNYGGLVAIRLMLGLCEGGLLPGMVRFL